MPPQRSRHLAPVIAALTLLGLTACGDPPPAANVAPVEIVLDGCILNRASVAAGTHDIAVVGSGEARITGPGGTPRFQLAGGGPSPQSFEMGEGTWTVTCTTDGQTTEARLDITP